ncbi:MAG: helix-turn-helix transcriptional regulator [Selenomonadaceae bacterium]|nr:helix-turn-helix transcriptional regulator [Selenomonadaceae bacterium]
MGRTVGSADNVFYQARMKAAARDTDFESRASTEIIVGISSTRLYQIERGIRQPHRDELLIMAKEYDAPELLETYCREMCPVGCKAKEVGA